MIIPYRLIYERIHKHLTHLLSVSSHFQDEFHWISIWFMHPEIVYLLTTTTSMLHRGAYNRTRELVSPPVCNTIYDDATIEPAEHFMVHSVLSITYTWERPYRVCSLGFIFSPLWRNFPSYGFIYCTRRNSFIAL